MPTTPIVLLSLPRSGSTLVQRVLAAHPGVATASEPWLLLSLLLALRDDVPAAGAWQPRVHAALTDFAAVLPDGVASYERAAGAEFYVDKTPPYFLVVDEIVRALPQARIVVLWRNPLAVLASVVETFCGGRWRPQDYPTSLFGGLERLVAGARHHGDRIHAVRYEDLIAGEEAWRRLTDHLGLEFDPGALERFPAVELRGEMGDKTGLRSYSELAAEPAEKWRRTISNPVRRAWARGYLDWIGPERLATMGYDHAALRAELASAGSGLSGCARDAGEAALSLARDAVKVRVGGGPSAWPRLLRAGAGGGR